MKPRQQRMLAVGLAAVGIIIATALTLRAFQENMMFFVEISDVGDVMPFQCCVVARCCVVRVGHRARAPDRLVVRS